MTHRTEWLIWALLLSVYTLGFLRYSQYFGHRYRRAARITAGLRDITFTFMERVSDTQIRVVTVEGKTEKDMLMTLSRVSFASELEVGETYVMRMYEDYALWFIPAKARAKAPSLDNDVAYVIRHGLA